jgi:hypothetical protein
VAGAGQALGHSAADVPGGSGDEDVHLSPLPSGLSWPAATVQHLYVVDNCCCRAIIVHDS